MGGALRAELFGTGVGGNEHRRTREQRQRSPGGSERRTGGASDSLTTRLVPDPGGPAKGAGLAAARARRGLRSGPEPPGCGGKPEGRRRVHGPGPEDPTAVR